MRRYGCACGLTAGAVIFVLGASPGRRAVITVVPLTRLRRRRPELLIEEPFVWPLTTKDVDIVSPSVEAGDYDAVYRDGQRRASSRRWSCTRESIMRHPGGRRCGRHDPAR